MIDLIWLFLSNSKKSNQILNYLFKNILNWTSKTNSKITYLSSLETLPSKYDYVVSMVPDSGPLRSLYFGTTDLSSKLNTDCLAIDCSTISPIQAKSISDELFEKSGITFLDCPVSGGVPGAINASLCFMVGADNEEIFEVNWFSI